MEILISTADEDKHAGLQRDVAEKPLALHPSPVSSSSHLHHSFDEAVAFAVGAPATVLEAAALLAVVTAAAVDVAVLLLLHQLLLRTCCNEFSAFPCPESMLELGGNEFIMFCCAVETPDKADIELCCKLVILLCGIVTTEPCTFIDCNCGFI
ncbi:unnamed protein product [Prunus armeniaca]